MENRIKSAFDHLADTDIEKINQQNIDLTAPDGAAERIEALVMKKIATSPESDTAPDDTAAAIILKSPCKKRIFRRATIIVAAAILAFAMTFGIAAQAGKIRQIFWFGSDGIESAEIIGTGEEEPVPTGYYMLKEPVPTQFEGAIEYAMLKPEVNGTSTLLIYVDTRKRMDVYASYRAMHLIMPDGTEYYPTYCPYINIGDNMIRIYACFEGLPISSESSYSFSLSVDASLDPYDIILDAADSTIFNDMLSIYEWNGFVISIFRLKSDRDILFLQLTYDSGACISSELKKILILGENSQAISVKVTLRSYDKDGNIIYTTSCHANGYNIYNPENTNAETEYFSVDRIEVWCEDISLNSYMTFDETYGIDMKSLVEEAVSCSDKYTVTIGTGHSVNENNETTYIYNKMFIVVPEKFMITLK